MLFAFILALLAGLSTLIGGLLGLHKNLIQRRTIGLALGFAAGAMLLVSFAEMIPVAQSAIAEEYGKAAPAITFAAFFVGVLLVAVIDRLVPDSINPNEREGLENRQNDGLSASEARKLKRSGVLITIAIALHNFPKAS